MNRFTSLIRTGLAWVFASLLSIAAALTAAAAEVKIHKAIPFAEPDGFALTLDIYVPQTGKAHYPVVVIYHGGGWLVNSNEIMHDMAETLARDGEFVVANMNYRLLGDQHNSVTINQIVEDVFGGLLWVKSHISQYQGNPEQIAVTGDSAGGHLASMILTRGRHLASDGFNANGLNFNPSYLPSAKTAEQIAAADGLKVQAAVISYGAFDLLAAAQNGFETPQNIFWQFAKAEPRGLFGASINANDNPNYYQAVSPLYFVPNTREYPLPPQFVHVGSSDNVTPPSAAQAYVDLLKAGQQPVEFKVYPNKQHAYLDSGCNWAGSCFASNALWPMEDIIHFLNKHLQR